MLLTVCLLISQSLPLMSINEVSHSGYEVGEVYEWYLQDLLSSFICRESERTFLCHQIVT